ncbi:MAG TPA: response regulator [Cytophagales bacterium]
MFGKILLVDDDKISLFLHTDLLQEMGLARQVISLANGQLALQYVQQHCLAGPREPGTCPDLILLDLHMPVMDGFEFLHALTRLGLSALIGEAVVVLTTSDNASDQWEAEQLRVKDYLVKPLTAETMTDFLDRHYGAGSSGH